ATDTGTDVRCEPRPYKYVVKAANEGTTVQSPDGKVVRPGVAKTVGAVVEILGLSHSSAITDEPLFKGDAAGISIVHPCIRVFKECDLQGRTCFAPNDPILFRGYVTNCGDITLTNVTVVDNRSGQLQLSLFGTNPSVSILAVLNTNAWATFSGSHP